MASRIALSGKPLAGKTTLARLLVEKYGYIHASTSSFLVSEYLKMMNEPWLVASRGYRLTERHIYENKEDFRGALQQMGDDLGMQDLGRVLGIMRQVLEFSGAWDHPESPVVLEAVRGEVQASAARAFGFVVVELWVDSETQERRAKDDLSYVIMREAMRQRPDIESGAGTAEILLTPATSTEDMATLLTIIPERGPSRGPADQPFEPGSLADWRIIR